MRSNPVKLCDSGKARLGTARAQCKGDLWLDVCDNGRRISEQDREAISSEFHQVADTLTDDPNRNGLGPHIGRETLEHFGSRLSVEISCRSDARFSFNLPTGSGT